MFRNLTNYSSHQGENLTAIYIGSINLTPSFRILSSLSWCHTTLNFFKLWSLKMKVTNRAFSHNSLNWPDHGMCVFVDIGDDRYTSISIKVLMMNKYRCSKKYLQICVNDCHTYVFSYIFILMFSFMSYMYWHLKHCWAKCGRRNINFTLGIKCQVEISHYHYHSNGVSSPRPPSKHVPWIFVCLLIDFIYNTLLEIFE